MYQVGEAPYNSRVTLQFAQLPLATLLILGGLLSCFVGQRIFRIVLAIYGFVLGALLASTFVAEASGPVAFGLVVAGGVVGALVLSFFYYMSVAILGAALAVAGLHVLWLAASTDPSPWLVLGCAVTGALVALLLQHIVIVTGTAFAGAWVLIAGVVALVHPATAEAGSAFWVGYPLEEGPWRRYWVPAWLVLGVLGTLVQLGRLGRARARARR
jgi:hypothetical protein